MLSWIPIGLGAYLPDQKTFVVADLHVGNEMAKRSTGVFLPTAPKGWTELRLWSMIDSQDVEKVVIAGDLKHEFGRVNHDEWFQLTRLIKKIRKKCEIILIRGNHDVIVPDALVDDIQLVDTYTVEGILILHGDQDPTDDELDGISSIIMGHEHPAINLTEGARSERFKIFLETSWEDRNVLVLPSFTHAAEGSDVLAKNFLSPILQDIGDDIMQAEVILIQEPEIPRKLPPELDVREYAHTPFGNLATIKEKLSM